jgi:hypothetical protein
MSEQSAQPGVNNKLWTRVDKFSAFWSGLDDPLLSDGPTFIRLVRTAATDLGEGVGARSSGRGSVAVRVCRPPWIVTVR